MSPVNIYPPYNPYYSVTKTINIRSNIQSTTNDIIYYAKFNILYNDCYQPRISIYYEDTDFDATNQSKFFHVYYEGQMIADCGSNTNTCNDYKHCLQNHSISSLKLIAKDSQFVIEIQKGADSAIPTGCLYSLFAEVTLQCFGNTTTTATPKNG